MAIMSAERSLVFGDEVRTNSRDIESESGDEELENLSQQELIKKIRDLQQRLDLEKVKQQLTDGEFVFISNLVFGCRLSL